MELAHEEILIQNLRLKIKKGRKKKGKVFSLIERLEEYKASVCLLLKNFNVPFDNYGAERSFRYVKVKTKVSGCFRTEDGAKDYVAIMSYFSTAQKYGIPRQKACLSSSLYGWMNNVMKENYVALGWNRCSIRQMFHIGHVPNRYRVVRS